MSTRDSNILPFRRRVADASVVLDQETKELAALVKRLSGSIRAFRRDDAAIQLSFIASDSLALARLAKAISDAAARGFKARQRAANRLDARRRKNQAKPK